MSELDVASRPELVYGQLSEPRTYDKDQAFAGVAEILAITVQGLDYAAISDALIVQTGIKVVKDRSIEEIGSRIMGLMADYPWLQKLPPRESTTRPITSRDFMSWANSHLFDYFPGLLGITPAEGRRIRGTMATYDMPNRIEEFEAFCEATGIEFNHQ